MAVKWAVTRTMLQRNNAQQSWDSVYQLLLRWEPTVRPNTSDDSISSEEDCDGSCTVCPRFQHSPANTDD
jgi:hypothetical protein